MSLDLNKIKILPKRPASVLHQMHAPRSYECAHYKRRDPKLPSLGYALCYDTDRGNCQYDDNGIMYFGVLLVDIVHVILRQNHAMRVQNNDYNYM